MPVNEVYMKASSEWMKNCEFGIHIEQLDNLIREQTRGTQGLAKGIRTKGNPRLGWPLPRFCPGLLTVLGDTEHVRLQPPACTSPAKRLWLGFGHPSALGFAQSVASGKSLNLLSLVFSLGIEGTFGGPCILGKVAYHFECEGLSLNHGPVINVSVFLGHVIWLQEERQFPHP